MHNSNHFAMKNLLAFMLFMTIVVLSFGQSKSNNYILTLNFWPSFMSASELKVQANKDSGFISIYVYKNYQKKELSIESQVVIAGNRLTALTNFLNTYKFHIKNNIDTVGHHKEFVHGDSILVYSVSAGYDGITINGLLNQNNISHKFAFWSPVKGTPNADLINIIFQLLEYSFADKKTIDYIEQLSQYFPHKLGLKKLSENPLKYKLFGFLSSNDEDELDNFLEHLPLHRRVIIDMSNFSGMGTMFYDEFEEYCKYNRNIYWLNPTYVGLVDLYKIGIPNRNIISKKKITKISEKDGKEVISSMEY